MGGGRRVFNLASPMLWFVTGMTHGSNHKPPSLLPPSIQAKVHEDELKRSGCVQDRH